MSGQSKDEGDAGTPTPAVPPQSGQHPVDTEVQEEAAKERAESGGYD